MKLFGSRCDAVSAIVRKDFLLNLRQRATFAAMMMFALTTFAALSLSTGGTFNDEESICDEIIRLPL